VEPKDIVGDYYNLVKEAENDPHVGFLQSGDLEGGWSLCFVVVAGEANQESIKHHFELYVSLSSVK
jgi:hypothetical protein